MICCNIKGKREADQRLKLLQSDLSRERSWVQSGSLCGWGDPLIPEFTQVIFTELDANTRMRRLAERERLRFGQAILPGGGSHKRYVEFMDWARSYDSAMPPTRSRRLHDLWLSQVKCPVIRVNTEAPINEVVHHVLGSIVAG